MAHLRWRDSALKQQLVGNVRAKAERRERRGENRLRLFQRALRKGEELEGEALYDFAVCLDIVHDCPFPDRILSTLCRLLKRKHSDQ